ncbi:hypothetical protein [Burkholderia ubonensis]|uniref:hypothetical protein n=1 Tax=Burkholderia ubonensis TaxID=101571 RepID=UPI002AAF1190|nr:hypothetical protein [Burkholderia ubonensis]
MEIIEKQASWIERNKGWVYPLIASVILILSPGLMSTFPGADEAPRWLTIVGILAGCLGAFWAGLQARLSASRSAQLFCLVVSVTCWVIAFWQIAEGLRH